MEVLYGSGVVVAVAIIGWLYSVADRPGYISLSLWIIGLTFAGLLLWSFWALGYQGGAQSQYMDASVVDNFADDHRLRMHWWIALRVVTLVLTIVERAKAITKKRSASKP